MQIERRSLLAIATLGLASAATGAAAPQKGGPLSADILGQLIRRNADGNAALMRGDSKTWARLLPLSADFTLMSPMGGESRGPYTPERIEEIGRFFKSGTFDQQVVQSYATADMIVLATIERAHVEVGGLPPQEWLLRVTVVFRRAASGWELVHRHADPLVKEIPVAHSAALTRGETSKAAGD
jgi:ketosteroid isomerase-like protein